MHAAEEPDVLEPLGLAAQLVAVDPVPCDQEIRRVVPPERLDQRLDALELDEPPDEQEVRASTTRALSRAGSADRRQRQEVGQMLASGRGSRAVRCCSMVDRLGERKRSTFARCRSPARVAPELRRPPERERAAQALPAIAELAVVPPEVVHRADQPVVVRRIELDRRRRSAGRPGLRRA